MLASSMKLVIGLASYWMHIMTMSCSLLLRKALTPAGDTRMMLPSPTWFFSPSTSYSPSPEMMT